jgi:TolB-like protein/Tfp pilus assembly protein PilF
MSSFFEELKRRNVFRVGVAYVVVAWLIIQVIETVSDPLGLPDWTEAFFIVLMLAGLPLILIFSWAFELTPEGLKKTSEVDVEVSVTADTGKKLNYATIAVLVFALGYFMWERQVLVEQAEQTVAETSEEVTETVSGASVAVLPFVNMSADPEQEFFSDGISEELLNLLAKIPELRVPARTSSFQFKGQNLDIGKVAEQLNVDHVLEGSVRKAGVRVRVTAQLIAADSGYHLWSDTYDRELDDIFAIQDEISAAIVAALSDTLGLETSVAPAITHAANLEAYNAYLLAQHQIKQRTTQSVESSITNYELALQHDPDYAPAHAGLGLAWYLLTASNSTYGTLPLEESLANAMPHLEQALALDSELPEALGNYGLVLEAQSKPEEALPYLEKALELNPSLTDVRNWYSQALSALGRPEDALREMEAAYQIDPLSVLTLNNYTNELLLRRRFETAGPVLDRLTQIDAARGMVFRGYMEINRGRAAEGIVAFLRAVDSAPDSVRARNTAATSLWNLGLQDAAISLWPYPDDLYPLLSSSVDAEYVLEVTQEHFDKNPDDPERLEALAWANFGAGKVETALELAGQFLDTLGEQARPLSFSNVVFAVDAWRRGDTETMLARIEPLEAALEREIASGVDIFWTRMRMALFSQIRGKPDEALEHFEIAAFRSAMGNDTREFFFGIAGWHGIPEFEDLERRHRDYMASERDKLLQTACGPDGFDAWRPSAEDCGRRSAPPVPN